MNNIDSTRSKFFPRAKTNDSAAGTQNINRSNVVRNTPTKQKYIDSYTKRDAKVDIPDAVKDFSKIKKAVDMAPERDNSDKIAALKQQIQAGTYKVDFDGVADKILSEEFGQKA